MAGRRQKAAMMEPSARRITQAKPQAEFTMSEHVWAERYRAAILLFEKHVHRRDDGTFALDAKDGKSIGIDNPVIFADLKRSLDETNRKIIRKELDPNQITNYAA